jgi:signal transduction histidine kinase/CheY-like chemotaxis protein
VASAIDGVELRVLLRTGTSRDALMTTALLARAGIDAVACSDDVAIARELDQGAGALIIAEEMLDAASTAALAGLVAAQPAWSDLPILMLARTGADSRALTLATQRLANVTVLERPMRIASLVSAVHSALRARRRQYELRAVVHELREADRRKTEFLATLAHELRNPLAPLSSALAILSRSAPTPAVARDHYDRMGRQLDHMGRLIDDLMEVSRITRGKIDLQLEAVRLDRVIQDAIELSSPSLDEFGHQLALTGVDPSIVVRGDRVRLTQVFANLLNNAAKYTPEGGRVEIAVSGDASHAVVSVRDNGAGIAPDMLRAVFDMFIQARNGKNAQGGLGIGLTLVKGIVEQHGGTVTAHSDGPGCGSEFRVTLPWLDQPAIEVDRPAETPGPLSSFGRVLVVDDNRDAADTLRDLLELLGAPSSVAYDGASALAIAESWRPAVAILDIGMPGMDGCELAIRLRARPVHAGLVLIALTGWGQDDDRERVARAGFQHHLLKPVSVAALTAVMRSSGEPQWPDGQASRPDPTQET